MRSSTPHDEFAGCHHESDREPVDGVDTEPVYCEDCSNLHSGSLRDKRSYYAMCSKFPRSRDAMGFVTRTIWDNDPPYYFCRKINHDGRCPHFTQRS